LGWVVNTTWSRITWEEGRQTKKKRLRQDLDRAVDTNGPAPCLIGKSPAIKRYSVRVRGISQTRGKKEDWESTYAKRKKGMNYRWHQLHTEGEKRKGGGLSSRTWGDKGTKVQSQNQRWGTKQGKMRAGTEWETGNTVRTMAKD